MKQTEQQTTPLGDSLPSRGYQFGTFKGVFTPSILTILGVIMFLRIGWVLGNVGLGATILIVTMSSAVTFLTGLSLSALATNKKIGGGGAYYIISRSLGLEVGSAIGLPLYCAQALGIAFYVAGFSEAFVGAFPWLDVKMVGVITLLMLTVLAYISADLALKTQYIVLACIVISLISFFAGGALDPSTIPIKVPPPPRYGFWVVFAVFFPAVTGIEVGIAMSGDLKKPSRSLPLGTISAVLVGYLIYLAIPIFLHKAVPDPRILVQEPLIMRHMARWGSLILLGVWAATLSSAMGSLLGAPRTLQALARDRVLPHFIGRGFGKGGDPRIATAITFLIALAAILGGGLNVIAPVLSMFFLTSYGMLNISAGLEEMVGVPSWRPTFRVPFWISLFGAFLCFSVMFMLNAGATIIAAVVLSIVYIAMKRRRLRVQWGDARYGILMMSARSLIYRLDKIEPDESTWEPNILVFSGAPTKRWYLIELAHVLSQGRGFITVATILPKGVWTRERHESAKAAINGYLRRRDVQALVKVMQHEQSLAGVRDVVASYGFGPIRPNVILLGDTEQEGKFEQYAQVVEQVHYSRRNLIIVRENKAEGDEAPILHSGSRIDVWLRRNSSNTGLMCTLAYLMKESEGWTNAQLIIKSVVRNAEEVAETRAWLEDYVEKQRIGAEIDILTQTADDVFNSIRASSSGADLVFMGLRSPKEGESPAEYAKHYEMMLKRTEDLPPTALVLTAEPIDFNRIFEEERR